LKMTTDSYSQLRFFGKKYFNALADREKKIAL
jgi:hypothetical protein